MIKKIQDADIKGKKVLIRMDYNVPLTKEQPLVVSDATKIDSSLKTINFCLTNEASKIILISHLGRPKNCEEEFSLKPVAEYLSNALTEKVDFIPSNNVIDAEVKQAIDDSQSKIIILENLRYRSGESKGDPDFSKELASLADIYINDAFACSHRSHSSITGVPAHLPSYMGFLFEKEVKFLGGLIDSPDRPFVGILGGAKVSDKIRVIQALLKKVDKLIIGGGMAYTFFSALGFEIGTSLVDDSAIDIAKDLLKKHDEQIVLPLDVKVAENFADQPPHGTFSVQEMPKGFMGLDIGEKTINKFQEILYNAKTVFWNGPVGVSEFENYSQGTKQICETLSKIDATTVIGGGDSAAAAIKLGYGDKMTFISTGGGASIEFIENGSLPGIDALKS